MNFNDLVMRLGDACYGLLALNFFWGLYCIIMGWRRVAQLSFRSQDQQKAFLDELMQKLHSREFDSAAAQCEDDSRALPQLAHLAIVNRGIGFEPLRHLVMEVLQRDVLGSLEYRTNWIATTIKSGPLLGLFGTVLGMMAAFGRIGTGEKVTPEMIAHDISIALICTAMGLATAIPFNFLLASIQTRVRRLQDSLASGVVRVLDFFKRNPT